MVSLIALAAACAEAQAVARQSAFPDASVPGAQAAADTKPAEAEPPGGKRIFSVLPNYRTTDATDVYTPIGPRTKLAIASKDSFDYPLLLLAAAFAGAAQLTGQNPSFGQGMAGFGRQMGTAYADQAIGNMMTEGFFPLLLREDPRYFRLGSGGKWHRTGYALTRIFVTRTDSGGTRFNFSEWVGNAAGVAISNSYYPDQRNVNDNVAKLPEQCGTDAVAQVLKEFWPDIKRKLFK